MGELGSVAFPQSYTVVVAHWLGWEVWFANSIEKTLIFKSCLSVSNSGVETTEPSRNDAQNPDNEGGWLDSRSQLRLHQTW